MGQQQGQQGSRPFVALCWLAIGEGSLCLDCVQIVGLGRSECLPRGVEASIYNAPMAAEPKNKPRGPWTEEEIERNERVAKARVARDRARGVSVNLEETVALTRFANRFAEAFSRARRA